MFSMRDIYPWYGYPETTEQTLPIERERKDPAAQPVVMVSPEDRNHIWFGLIIFVIIIALINTKF